jgi:putative ABC transport system permease protein
MRDIGTSNHEAHPFKVVGILARTFTPIDRSVYITLEGIEAMHEDFEKPAAPVAAAPAAIAPSVDKAARGAAAKSAAQARIRARNQARAETPLPKDVPPVMPGAEPPPGTPLVMPGASPPPGTPLVMPGASSPPGTPMVMPGAEPPPTVATPQPKPPTPAPAAVETVEKVEAPEAELDHGDHNHGDDQITSFFVGTKNRFEALMLQREMNTDLVEPLTAVIPGVALGQAPIEERFGLHLSIRPLGATEWTYLAVVFGAGVLIGFVPALKAYRTSLVDGLSPRA